MIYLYIKTHNKTGLKYFGKTANNDPHSYQGSGRYWKRHIAKHGYDVTTEILGCFENDEDCTKVAISFSIEHGIVNSPEWANLREENGLDGAPKGNFVSEETRSKISTTLQDKRSPKSKYVIREPIEKRSKRIKEFMAERVWANDGVNNRRIKWPLPAGWREGRLGDLGNKSIGEANKQGNNTRGKKIYNNGIKHAYFFEHEVPQGWVSGKMEGYQGGTGSLKKGKSYG